MEECERLNEELSRLDRTTDVPHESDDTDSPLISEARNDFDAISILSSVSQSIHHSHTSEQEEDSYVFDHELFSCFLKIVLQSLLLFKPNNKNNLFYLSNQYFFLNTKFKSRNRMKNLCRNFLACKRVYKSF